MCSQIMKLESGRSNCNSSVTLTECNGDVLARPPTFVEDGKAKSRPASTSGSFVKLGSPKRTK